MRYILTDTYTWDKLKGFVQENRKDPTYAEQIIWTNLRRKQLGYRFRRQHAIYRYIVDFVCIEKKLIIEIDGDSHDDKQEYDAEREKELRGMGFDVLRFTNEEVFQNGNKVIAIIKDKLNEKE
ncbi:MAG: endonuclease domain-containing protein [Candidatus Kapabacteria bacterium]|nr:endonuclease domain-containing protein [Candidatus Kapabacteria bacterium]